MKAGYDIQETYENDPNISDEWKKKVICLNESIRNKWRKFKKNETKIEDYSQGRTINELQKTSTVNLFKLCFKYQNMNPEFRIDFQKFITKYNHKHLIILYGYMWGYKQRELARMHNTSQQSISLILAKIKKDIVFFLKSYLI